MCRVFKKSSHRAAESLVACAEVLEGKKIHKAQVPKSLCGSALKQVFKCSVDPPVRVTA